jgi:hypothetical protein
MGTGCAFKGGGERHRIAFLKRPLKGLVIYLASARSDHPRIYFLIIRAPFLEFPADRRMVTEY